MSVEHKEYLKKLKKEKIFILVCQFMIIIGFILIWELLSKYNIINSFIFSSPSKIVNTLYNLYLDKSLFYHIWVTLKEIIISFILGSLIGFILAVIFYMVPILKKIFDHEYKEMNKFKKLDKIPSF